MLTLKAVNVKKNKSQSKIMTDIIITPKNIKTIQVKAYLTANQEILFHEWTDGMRHLYNLALGFLYEDQQRRWRTSEKFLKKFMDKEQLEDYLKEPDTYPVVWTITKALPNNEKDTSFGLACSLTNKHGIFRTEIRTYSHIENPAKVARDRCHTIKWLDSDGVKLLPQWKLEAIKKVSPTILRSSILMHLMESWKRYLKGDFRRLRFKSQSNPVVSLANKQTSEIKFYPQVNDVLLLSTRFGLIKFRGLKDRHQGEIQPRNGSLSKKADGFYLSLTFELPQETKPNRDNIVGIDPGVVNLLTLSDGRKYRNPRFLRDSFKRLRLYQHKLSRQKLKGENWKKTQAILARIHKKIADQRRLYNHEVSTDIINRYQFVGIEDTKLTNMVKAPKAKKREDGEGYEQNGAKRKAGLNKAILDSGIGQLRTFLEAKASGLDNREVIRVPAKHTSQKCSRCGHVAKENRLNQAEFCCQECGLEINADLNAAINIEAYVLGKDTDSD